MDLSGWLPKYFPPLLVRQLNTLLKHKVLFGSDFPVITLDRWNQFRRTVGQGRGQATDHEGRCRSAARAQVSQIGISTASRCRRVHGGV